MKNTTAQAYQQAPWRTQIQWIGLFLLALMLVAGVAGIYLSVSSTAATAGREVQIIQNQIDTTQRNIADKSSQLASLTSSAQMEQRAAAMGFKPVDPTTETFISVPGYEPRQGAELAPQPGPVILQPPLIKPSYTLSLWGWLTEEITSASQAQAQK